MIHRGWFHKVARRLVGRREFHAFNVGAGRTGTVSIHAMFAPCYVSMHEPEADILVPLIIENDGKSDRGPFRDYVVGKDRRLRLEMDSSGLNVFLLGEIVAAFPEAKFLFTVRDVFSWAESMYNRTLNHKRDATWEAWRDFAKRRWPSKYHRGEEMLERLGLRPIHSLFSQWRDLNQTVLETVPPERRLLVKTEEISTARERIAAFLGIPADTLATPSPRNRTSKPNQILAQLDRNLVNDAANAYCAGLMKIIYPESDVKWEALVGS